MESGKSSRRVVVAGGCCVFAVCVIAATTLRSRSKNPTNERAVNPQLDLRTLPPVPLLFSASTFQCLCSHPQPRRPLMSSTSLGDESTLLVGRDINRGLVVACLILTTASARASSDRIERDKFLTCGVHDEFPAFSAEMMRCGLTRPVVANLSPASNTAVNARRSAANGEPQHLPRELGRDESP